MKNYEQPLPSVPEKTATKPNALARLIAQSTVDTNRADTEIQGLSLHRWAELTEPTSYMLAPSICLIGQGSKRLYLQNQSFDFDPNSYLVTSVDLPVVSQITTASNDQPYLGLTLELDLKVIAQMMLDQDIPIPTPGKQLGVAVSSLSHQMRDAFVRLLELMQTPNDIAGLAPLIKQEIYHRLLRSEQGPRLRQIISTESQSHHIARVIEWLTKHYDETFKVESLAEKAGLSASAFHNHFRAVTAMSPLQFQKKIRLNEARRLMLSDRLDAATAAFKVGYESPSQFSREYSRMFGAPPKRDISRMMQSNI